MKKLTIAFLIVCVSFINTGARDFYKGLNTRVSKVETLDSFIEIVRLFDEHAKMMGGAGFRFGVKSKVTSLFTHSHRELLQDYLLRTPLYMLYSSGISEDDPDLGKRFVAFCDMMPTVYDNYKTCAKKMDLCVRALYPGESDRFYEDTMEKIRKKSGVNWL